MWRIRPVFLHFRVAAENLGSDIIDDLAVLAAVDQPDFWFNNLDLRDFCVGKRRNGLCEQMHRLR
jgi:hypothetical protein